MSRIFNFAAGPAMLPEAVLKQVQSEFLDWNDQGASVMELSHRGKPFLAVAEEAEQGLRDLLTIPDDYSVLFLQGGATTQFSSVPLNLGMTEGKSGKADYAVTGHWGVKAVKDAARFIEVNEVCNTSDSKFTSVPDANDWNLSDDADYVHITPNETIAGVEFEWLPETDKPIVADMSSTILSRPLDIKKYGIIYAGAQKNIGPAGITIVIIRNDLMGNCSPVAPRLMDYKVMAESDSMSNTPPTLAWYISAMVFKWLKEQGGLSSMREINQRKANKLYDYIDNSDGFYTNPVANNARSLMNVPFILKNNDLDADFLAKSHTTGLHALKGHRSVGGMRASIYNAMPEAGIDALITFMDQFKNQNA